MVIAIFLVGQIHSKAMCWRRSWSATNVGLHPVWVIFALFAFGYLFGFVGLLIAVPLAAAVGVLSRFAPAPVSGEPDLHRRQEPQLTAGCRGRHRVAPRQLALALDHAESFARENFLTGPSNAAALR